MLRNKTLRYFEGNPRAFEVNERKERRRLLGQKEAMDKKKEHVSAYYICFMLELTACPSD